ncbi:hypothetical protein PM082_009967 [Marasmius tenuissimus]|nr:hypothetical protein PM082_009967 [Marasmius tenuissimus]
MDVTSGPRIASLLRGAGALTIERMIIYDYRWPTIHSQWYPILAIMMPSLRSTLTQLYIRSLTDICDDMTLSWNCLVTYEGPLSILTRFSVASVSQLRTLVITETLVDTDAFLRLVQREGSFDSLQKIALNVVDLDDGTLDELSRAAPVLEDLYVESGYEDISTLIFNSKADTIRQLSRLKRLALFCFGDTYRPGASSQKAHVSCALLRWRNGGCVNLTQVRMVATSVWEWRPSDNAWYSAAIQVTTLEDRM